jgi:predicted nucleic acid-binding protein
MRRSAAPPQIVIDASALIELLTHTTLAPKIDRLIGDAELIAPDVLNPEVLEGLRGLERGGQLTSERASMAAEQLCESKIERVPTNELLRKIWSMRANVSSYDACYVALARAFDCPLLTSDRKLTRAPALGVGVMLPA